MDVTKLELHKVVENFRDSIRFSEAQDCKFQYVGHLKNCKTLISGCISDMPDQNTLVIGNFDNSLVMYETQTCIGRKQFAKCQLRHGTCGFGVWVLFHYSLGSTFSVQSIPVQQESLYPQKSFSKTTPCSLEKIGTNRSNHIGYHQCFLFCRSRNHWR